MKSTQRNRFAYPLYPWLLVTYLIVFLYSQNIGLVKGIEVIYTLVAAWLSVSVAMGIAFLVTRSVYTAAAIVAVTSAVFLTVGHALNLLPPRTSYRLVYSIAALAVLVVTLAIWRLKRLAPLIKGLVLPANIIVAFLLIVPVFQIVQYHLLKAGRVVTLAPKINNSPDKPDIYYIILDGYSSNAHLLRDYNYDNSDFTRALEERGFFVAYDSTSNYVVTLASIPSSLNMRYFDEQDAKNAGPLGLEHTRDMLSNNSVASDLRAMGYTYVNMMSGYTAPSPIADENIDFHLSGIESYQLNGDTNAPDCAPECYQQSFINFFLRTTMLRPFISNEFGSLSTSPYLWGDPRRQLAMWKAVPDIAARDEATFAFIHIIKPHAPVVFGEDGQIHAATTGDAESFFQQLRFVNQQTLTMIDQILEKSQVPPIIVLQGDHGTDLGELLDPNKRYTYFEIMNAFYWPGVSKDTIPSDITPVNSFRLLFNTYFGTDYDMLENRHFESIVGYDDILNLAEVELEDVIKNRPKPDPNSTRDIESQTP
jgi:hypothetical protein